MKIAAVILAGGQATRMGGGDKCLRLLGDRPMLAHVIDRLAPLADRLVLNANGDPARFNGFGLPVLADALDDFQGPLAGILAAMRWAKDGGATHLLSVAADTPFFPDDLCAQLKTALLQDQADIAIAQSLGADGKKHRQPTFGLWDVELADDLAAFLDNGDRKIILWAQRHKLVLPCVAADDAFFNINTPADLDAAQVMAQGV